MEKALVSGLLYSRNLVKAGEGKGPDVTPFVVGGTESFVVEVARFRCIRLVVETLCVHDVHGDVVFGCSEGWIIIFDRTDMDSYIMLS